MVKAEKAEVAVAIHSSRSLVALCIDSASLCLVRVGSEIDEGRECGGAKVFK